MSTTPALAALRARREELGLKRQELYVHPEDWPAVKEYAAKAQRKRERAAKAAPPPPPPAPPPPPPVPDAVTQRIRRRLARHLGR